MLKIKPLFGYLKTSRLTFEAGFLIAGRIFQAVTNLIIFIIFSRLLSETQYGTFRQLLFLLNIITQLTLLGLPSSLNFFLVKSSDRERNYYLSQTLQISFFIAFINMLVIFVFRENIAQYFNNPSLNYLLTLILPAFLFYPILFIYPHAYIATNAPSLAITTGVGVSLIWLCCLLITGVFFSEMRIIAYSITIAVIVQYAYTVIRLKRYFKRIFFALQLNKVRRQLAYAIPLGLSLMAGFISKSLDKVLIGYYYSPDDFAIYSNGAVELPLVGLLNVAITPILLREFSYYYKSGEIQKIIVLWNNVIRKMGSIIFPIMIFSIFNAVEIIEILFTKKYAASAGIFLIYLFVLPLRVTVFGSILSAIDKTQTILKYALLGLFINFLMTITLINTIGIIGAAVATVFAAYVINMGQLREIAKQLKVQFINLIPYKDIVVFIGISLISLLTTFIVPEKVNLYIGFSLKLFLFITTYTLMIIIFSKLRKKL